MGKAKVSICAKRRLCFLCLMLFGAVALLFRSVYKDWKQIFYNIQSTKQLTEEYNHLQDEEESLESEVTKLQDPEYVARYAREKYLYSKEGELIIKLPEDK